MGLVPRSLGQAARLLARITKYELLLAEQEAATKEATLDGYTTDTQVVVAPETTPFGDLAGDSGELLELVRAV